MYFQYRRGKSILFYDSKDYEYFSSSAHVDVDVRCDEIAVPLYFPYHSHCGCNYINIRML
jgi:hypothetical protein